MKVPLFLNTSYASGLSLNSAAADQTLASVSANNFSMHGLFGPKFSPKCVVGFQGVAWGTGIRGTLSFNLSSTGIFNLISSSHYLVDYSWFCMAEIICPSSSHQYYPVINQCEPACLILNCSICSTSTSCSSCQPGFFLNTLYRCDACVSHCLTCTSSSLCDEC